MDALFELLPMHRENLAPSFRKPVMVVNPVATDVDCKRDTRPWNGPRRDAGRRATRAAEAESETISPRDVLSLTSAGARRAFSPHPGAARPRQQKAAARTSLFRLLQRSLPMTAFEAIIGPLMGRAYMSS